MNDISEPDMQAAKPLSFEEYEARELRRKRRQAAVTWVAIAVATVAVPLSYLGMTGQFSTVNLASSQPAKTIPRKADGLKTYGEYVKPKLSAHDQAHLDALKSDFADFVNHDLATYANQEKISLIAFSNVTGHQFKDAATTFRVVRNDVIPAQQKLIALAENVHPKTDAVRDLNSTLLLAAKMRLHAYEIMIAGENDPDALWKYGFQADLDDANDKARNFRSRLNSLAIDTGVKLP